MITSLIEMLELPNFGHMTTSTINLSYVIKFAGHIMNRNYDVITFISKHFFKEGLEYLFLPTSSNL